MANILMVTASTTHASAVNTKAAIETGGHTVTAIQDNGTLPNAASYAAIVVVRWTPANVLSWLKTQWGAGKPILLGGAEVGQLSAGTNSMAKDMGLLQSPYVTDQNDTASRNIQFNANTTGPFPAATSYSNTVVTSGNWAVRDLGTPAGTVIGTIAGSNPGVYGTYLEANDALIQNGVNTILNAPARLIWMGWVYAGQSDYTSSGDQNIVTSLNWLTTPPPVTVLGRGWGITV